MKSKEGRQPAPYLHKVMAMNFDFGLGHVGRCIPIASRLEKNGAEIMFSTYREGLKYVQQEGFQAVEAPDIGSYNFV